MRTGDLTAPTVPAHTVPPDAPVASWPGRLKIGLQRTPGGTFNWDTGLAWDDTDPAQLWDAPSTAPVWVDAVCDFQALDIDDGTPDELGLFPARQLTLSLDNRTGTWSTWTAAGRAAGFPVGSPVAVTVNVAGDTRWLFAGYVAEWSELGDRVAVTAYDPYSDLAADWGGPWTPGTPAQRPKPRVQAIATQARWPGTITGDTGHTDLTTAAVDADVSPLEAMQVAVLSDGGIVFGDPDGKVVVRDRYWRTGRSDQTRVWSFTDNACDTAALDVWDVDAGASDQAVATDVRLTNAAAVTVIASTGAVRPIVLTHPTPDLWPNATVGKTLADWLLQQAYTAGWRLNSFALHLLDPNQTPDLFAAGTDLRRADRINFLTDTRDPTGAVLRLDVDVICTGVRHEITPDEWLTTVAGTRSVAARTGILWDSGALWDNPDPSNVWTA